MQQYVDLVDRCMASSANEDGEANNQGFSLANASSTMQLAIGDSKSQEAWSKREEIFDFSSNGKIKELQQLVDSNAKESVDKEGKTVKFVDVIDSSERTPLHFASDRGELEVVKLLVGAGATVDLQDEDGMTALATAVLCEHEDICR